MLSALCYPRNAPAALGDGHTRGRARRIAPGSARGDKTVRATLTSGDNAMFGFAIRFKLKKSLIGIAAASLLAPIASHADVSPGRWIFDGFSRSTRDGQGSSCVGSGGETYAFDSPECTGSAEAAKATRQAEQAKRDAAMAAEMSRRRESLRWADRHG